VLDIKRAGLPFLITSSCSTCRREHTLDLAGSDYVGFPRVVASSSEIRPPNKLYFYCADDVNDCDTEWEVSVAILVSMEVLV
jgi:hypothetical protein